MKIEYSKTHWRNSKGSCMEGVTYISVRDGYLGDGSFFSGITLTPPVIPTPEMDDYGNMMTIANHYGMPIVFPCVEDFRMKA